MDFITHYLFPSLIFGFKFVLKWILIAGFAFAEVLIVMLLGAMNFLWCLLILVFFCAIDIGILNAWFDWKEDQERIARGWQPKHRKKKS